MIAGLIVGGLGRLLHRGPDPMPIWVTIVIGLAASLIAGILFGGLIGFIVAVAIAVGLVALVSGSYSFSKR